MRADTALISSKVHPTEITPPKHGRDPQPCATERPNKKTKFAAQSSDLPPINNIDCIAHPAMSLPTKAEPVRPASLAVYNRLRMTNHNFYNSKPTDAVK